jgi:hypothetical protein
VAIGGILRAAMMAQDWGSVVRQSRNIHRNRQLLPVVNEFPLRKAHIARTKARLSPEPWRGSVDRRVADNISVQQVGAVDDELKASLLRRYNRGQTVPSWFEPTDSSALLRYNIERAKAGLGGQGGQRVPVRSPAEAKRAYEKVASGVGATKVPYEKIREIQNACGVSGNAKVCRVVSDRIERELGYPMQLGFWKARQHAWNVMPDGTIIDATASQFGLPPIHVVPRSIGEVAGYRRMTPGQVKYWEEADLHGFGNLSDEDWISSSLGRGRFEFDPWIAEGLDYGEMPWDYARRRGQELSDFFMMPYGQQARPRVI